MAVTKAGGRYRRAMLWLRIHPTVTITLSREIGFTTNSAHYIGEIPAAHSGDSSRGAWRAAPASLHQRGSSPMAEGRFSRGERQSNRRHVRGGEVIAFAGGEPARASVRASQQTEAGSGCGSIRATPLGRGPRKSRQLVEALPRHGTAPDTKHCQTAWRPPVSFVSAPASRRPLGRYYPSTDPAIRRSPVRARVPTDSSWSMTLVLWYRR